MTADAEREDETLARNRIGVQVPPDTPLRFAYNQALDLLTIQVGVPGRKEKDASMMAGETSFRDFAGHLVRIQVRSASHVFPAEWLERHRDGFDS